MPASVTVALQLKYWRRSRKVLLNKGDRSHSSLFPAFHPTGLCFAHLAGMIFSKPFHLCFDICFSNHIIKNTACLFHVLLAVNFIIWATILFYHCKYSENPCGWKNALSWNTEGRDEIFAKHLLIRILIYPSRTWVGQQKHRGAAVLNWASSNSEVLHWLLKSMAQAGPQAPGVGACLNQHSWPFVAGAGAA